MFKLYSSPKAKIKYGCVSYSKCWSVDQLVYRVVGFSPFLGT